MSRPIKFRAWDKKNKVMYQGVGLDSSDTLPRCITGGGVDPLVALQFANVELMQFTGLLDKNGKEIYEGDIVNARNWGRTNEILHKGTVIWDTQTAAWAFDPWFDVDEYDRWRNIEVIGNIYEPK